MRGLRFRRFRDECEVGAVGSRIIILTAAELRGLVRRLLTLLQVPGASAFNLSRIGKASAMIASGVPLKDTMAAREWRSASIAHDESVIESSRALLAGVDESDEKD